MDTMVENSNELARSTAERTRLAGQVLSLTQTLAETEQRLAKATFSYETLFQAWQVGPGARIQQLRDQVSHLEAQAASAASQLAQTRGQLQDAVRAHAELVSASHKDYDAETGIQSRVTRIQAQLEEMTKKWQSALSEVSQAQSQLQGAHNDYAELVSSHRKVSGAVVEAQSRVVSTQTKLDEMTGKWQSALAEVAERDRRITQIHSFYAALVDEHRRVVKVAAEAPARESNAQTQLEMQVASITSQLSLTQRQLRSANSAHAALVDDRQKMRSTVVDALRKVADVRDQFEEMTKKWQSALAEVAKRDRRISKLHELQAETLSTLRTLTPPTVEPVDVTAAATVVYQVLPAVNVDALIGATTSQPPYQTMMDVYRLIQRLLGQQLAAPLAMPIGGGTGLRTISVPQGSYEDIALAGFPSLVKRTS